MDEWQRMLTPEEAIASGLPPGHEMESFPRGSLFKSEGKGEDFEAFAASVRKVALQLIEDGFAQDKPAALLYAMQIAHAYMMPR